jgi:glycine C-acetyltransferase
MTTIGELYRLMARDVAALKESKTYKFEIPLESEQAGVVRVDGREVVMLASNNYLGLANHPKVKEAAERGLRDYGFGLASVRFICGTQKIHRELEEKIAAFVGCEDAILHSSCFTANEAFFSGLLANDFGFRDYRDVIYSDQLNHASIIDGVRLCRVIAKSTEAKVYAHRNTDQLGQMLEADRAEGYRIRVIATDGVFSMEGDLAPLPELVRLARQHEALLVVDDSHATGVLGARGRGTAEELGVFGQIDVITGTFGKALGGACGGFIAARRELVELLRQKSRPYTFSNTMPPSVVCGSSAALDLLMSDTSLVERLRENTAYFRREITTLGYTILEGQHPIVPIMLGEAALAMEMSVALLEEGVYIKGLWYPVVPKGEARLRAQISAAHTRDQLDRALEAFRRVGRRWGITR